MTAIADCIGKENDDKIKRLETKVNGLEFKIKLLEKEKVDSNTLHKLEKELLSLSSQITEMRNNRIEDRQAISNISKIVQDLSSQLETYVENTYEITANQKIYHEKIDMQNELIKQMRVDIAKNNIFNQIREFSNKSKWHGAFVKVMIFLSIATLLSAFMFYANDGATLKDVLEWLKEVI